MLDSMTWDSNWAWALPLIVVTVALHVVGLAAANLQMVRAVERIHTRGHFLPRFVLVMSVLTLYATVLIGLEASLWAITFCRVGALPDFRLGMLYSLNAITTYGHTDLHLPPHWQLMGALEALNGVLIFGLTTAFLYGHISRVWPVELRSAGGDTSPSRTTVT